MTYQLSDPKKSGYELGWVKIEYQDYIIQLISLLNAGKLVDKSLPGS
jgi:hypothetical protein